MERWETGGELRTGVFTVPTEGRKWDVDLWVQGVESAAGCRIGAGVVRGGFAAGLVCPQFAQGGWEEWKSGWWGGRSVSV